MPSFFLRVLLATDVNQPAQSQRPIVPETAAAASPGDATLPVARLARPGAAAGGAFAPGNPDGYVSPPAPPAGTVSRVEVTGTAELYDLLAQQTARRAAELLRG